MPVAGRGTYKDFKLKLANREKEFGKGELQELIQWVYKNAPDITKPQL